MKELYRARYVGRVSEIPCILQECHPAKQLDKSTTPEALQTLLIRVVMEALLCIEDRLNCWPLVSELNWQPLSPPQRVRG